MAGRSPTCWARWAPGLWAASGGAAFWALGCRPLDCPVCTPCTAAAPRLLSGRGGVTTLSTPSTPGLLDPAPLPQVPKLPERLLAEVARQVVSGLAYLHGQLRIVHRCGGGEWGWRGGVSGIFCGGGGWSRAAGRGAASSAIVVPQPAVQKAAPACSPAAPRARPRPQGHQAVKPAADKRARRAGQQRRRVQQQRQQRRRRRRRRRQGSAQDQRLWRERPAVVERFEVRVVGRHRDIHEPRADPGGRLLVQH
jgi:hypothetical protein